VAFGSFNTMAKVTDEVLDLWARVLQAMPGSRLFMKNLNLGSEATRERVRARLGATGIDAGRVELSGEVPGKDEHLRAYGKVDVALDPFPYNGTTTTVEAMLMGVPVVTLLGDSHRARVSASLLSVVGHPEWIAKDADEYVRITTQLAGDRKRLSGLRSSLRNELLSSPLCDGPGFTRRLEAVYRDLWKRWCAAT
jgi:predicted O-linked N-acetylglucosamine transferase (SPINDLY family)